METVDNEIIKSKKDALIERLRTKKPDSNYENEEDVYGDILTEMDEMDGSLKGYKENEDRLIGAFEKNPKLANLFLEMEKGENPYVFLLENFGDEFREALDDPESKDKFVEASNKYIERIAKEKELQALSKKNLTATLEALTQAQAETGCSDDDTANAFELFATIIDDAIVQKASKETWVMIIKALKHDIDVEEASHEAEIRGKNAKIDGLKAKNTVPKDMPPQISGQANTTPKKGAKIEGALARFGDKKGMWD